MTLSAVHTNDIIDAWKRFLANKEWEALIQGVEPRETGCGLIFELKNPLDRPTESFAICDTRNLARFEPHYHISETEMYIVLQGTGTQVVGGQVQQIEPGSIVVIPPETAHFTVPDKDLVMAVINTPPFDHENTRGLTESDPDVKFDRVQYDSFFN